MESKKNKIKSAPKSSFTDGHEIGWRYHDSRSREKISRIQEWSWTASRPFWAESAIWGELEDSHFTLLFRILSKPQLEAGMWRLYSSSCVDRWCKKLRHGDHLRPTTHFQRPVTWQKKEKTFDISHKVRSKVVRKTGAFTTNKFVYMLSNFSLYSKIQISH